MDDQPPNARQPDDAAEPPSEWTALARRLAGESDANAEAEARAWLAAHAGEAAAIAALDATLDRLAFTPPPDLDVEAALRRVKARRDAAATNAATTDAAPRVLPMRRPAARRVLGVPAGAWRAAAAVLAVVGGAALWRATRPAAGDAPHRYATIVGARDSVRLADGTRVVLGPASTLDVPADYGRARRDVTLRGEAYFDVRHDAARPFVVHTASATMQDVGTAFAVRESADGRVTLAVTEGTVMLRATAAGADAAGTLVRSGDRGTVAPGRPVAIDRAVVTADDVAWTRGRLVFHDATLPEVAAELRRWYGVELRADDPALAGRHLTAAFGGEPVDEVLRVVGLALGADVTRRGDTAFVRVPPGGAPAR